MTAPIPPPATARPARAGPAASRRPNGGRRASDRRAASAHAGTHGRRHRLCRGVGVTDLGRQTEHPGHEQHLEPGRRGRPRLLLRRVGRHGRVIIPPNSPRSRGTPYQYGPPPPGTQPSSTNHREPASPVHPWYQHPRRRWHRRQAGVAQVGRGTGPRSRGGQDGSVPHQRLAAATF
jgi:hypothetical protein